MVPSLYATIQRDVLFCWVKHLNPIKISLL